MKTQKTILALAVLLCITAVAITYNNTNNLQQKQFSEQAFFCPEDNCASKLVQQINQSEKSVHAAIYSFTSAEIANALIEAKKRGVEVKIITDSLQAESKYSKDEFLQQNGIEVKIKKIGNGSMHNKFMIIDNKLVATGSFNYTENANEKNDENLVFLANPEIASEFESEFSEIWQQAS